MVASVVMVHLRGRRAVGVGIGVWVVLTAGLAGAQRRRDAGVDAALDAGPGAAARVDAVRGSVAALMTRSGRARGPGEVTVALPLRRGGCYVLLGAADGEAQATGQVWLRAGAVTDPMAMAHAEGRVGQSRFCVEEAPELYRLTVQTEGPVVWHLVLTDDPRPPGAAPGPGPAARDAGAPAAHVVSTEVHEIGGGAADYVGAQLRAYAAARPGRVGFTPVVRQVLATHEQHSRTVVLPAGRCIESVAAGVPSVADLELLIEDPNGNRVAQDGTRRSAEGVRFCPVFTGTYTLRVRVRMGAGLVGMQCLIEP